MSNLTPDAFRDLVAQLPRGERTMGDLLRYLDDTAHESEDRDHWHDAASIRELQASVLRFIQTGIDGGVIDVHAACVPTMHRNDGLKP